MVLHNDLQRQCRTTTNAIATLIRDYYVNIRWPGPKMLQIVPVLPVLPRVSSSRTSYYYTGGSIAGIYTSMPPI